MLSDKIKGKSAFKARTFLHERDKVHVCYWFRLSMHLSTENSAGCLRIHRNSSAMVINKTDMPRARIRSLHLPRENAYLSLCSP